MYQDCFFLFLLQFFYYKISRICLTVNHNNTKSRATFSKQTKSQGTRFLLLLGFPQEISRSHLFFHLRSQRFP